MTRIFGIRHHGPGSARRLLNALKRWQPDCVLIELPEDVTPALKWAQHPKLVPPVALLIYHPKNLQMASFLPFAEFSPEWQAIQYALHNEVPIKAMDLPMGLQFALRDNQKNLPVQVLASDLDADELRLRLDPMHYLATLAGYEDSERWWERMFEEQSEEEAVFDAIQDMMNALREGEGLRKESAETLLREAWMRNALRQAEKEGFQRIAVVCGAWHGPALADLSRFAAKNDNALLKSLKKEKTQCTWIPWTYERLAFKSGYAAGILSPAWYELLFHHAEERNIRWMIRVAELLRERDLPASPAHVQEAVRLAETLAALRERPAPGIDDLEEAALAVFFGGDQLPLDFIRQALIIGHTKGEVPPQVTGIPLQEDFEAGVKNALLSKEYRDGSSKNEPKKLDLRVAANLRASQFLHRIAILSIPWASQTEVSDKVKGSFHEHWIFKPWMPEFVLQLIEMGMWGNTVREAALHYVLNLAQTENSLGLLLQRLGQVLKADLPEAVGPMTQKMQALGAQTFDVMALMEALAPLTQMLRYGNVRATDTQALAELLDQILPRVCLGLPHASCALDDEPARVFFSLYQSANRAVALLQNQEAIQMWQAALLKTLRTPQAHPLLAGLATRILLDKQVLDIATSGLELSAALSRAEGPGKAAEWLEGFLHGSGQLLLHNFDLWKLLDEWLQSLDYEVFREALPVLRRTFSQFHGEERKQMFDLAKNGPLNNETLSEEYDLERANLVLTGVRPLLGLV
jgi:hypothetical protein